MKKRILLIFIFVAITFSLYCGLLEPEKPCGSLSIVLLQEETPQNNLPKINSATTHESVLCVVKKGSQTVFNNNLTKKDGGGFHGEINDLEPAENYSVLLYGKSSTNSILSRAYKSDISVSAGKQSSVTLTWSSFTPAPASPADGSSLSETTPTFNWSAVAGVNIYELEVDDNNNFGSPVIKNSNLISNSFTAQSPLSDGTYFWRVRGKDAEGNWGEWSDIFQFTISVAVLSVTPTSLDFGSTETTKTFTISNTGTGTLTWNITDDSNWITVSPASGNTSTATDQITVTVDRSNMASGMHTGSVSIISNNGTKTVSVSASKEVPDLSVSPQSLDFGSSEEDKSFFITNSGTGTLTWNVSDDKDWISVIPVSGSTSFETDELNVKVDRSNLGAGIHTGTITVTSNGGTETISVTASKEVPDLSVSTSSLDFGSSITSSSFNITNSGTGSLTWSVGDDRTWININPTSGETTSESDPVSVSVDLSSLGAGTYTGTITITSNGGTATISVSASKEVADLSVSTNELDFGSSETNKNFNISNIGNGTLTWEVNSDKSWITVNPTSGSTTTQTDPVTVTVDRSSLSPGTFTGTVTVTSNGGTETITVSASKEVPDLSVTPTALDFGSNDVTKTFNINNSGSGTLTWTISDNKSWITVDPTQGSTTSETKMITVTIDRNSLTAGAYTGAITISSNGGTETVEVTVSEEVPSLSVSPTALAFRSDETSKTFDIVNSGTGVLTWSVSDDRTWISLTPVNGTTTTETDKITVNADLSSLGGGTYTGTITITSNGGTKTVAISASKEVPDLSVSATTLDFGSSETSKSFNISNVGTGTLAWNVGTDKNWISVNPKTGSTTTQPTQVSVSVDRANLGTGTFTGTITVTSNGGTKTISVSASKEVPDLSVTPTALDFGSNESSKTFNISNIGNGTLTWNVSDDKDWISVSPAAGSTTSGSNQITVSVDRTNLSGGTFSGTVTVTSNGGTKTISVSVVNEAPQLSVTPLTLDFGLNETSKTFAITNIGTGTLTWQIDDDRLWLITEPTSGSTAAGANDNITVNVNRTLLALVRDDGTITITSNGGTETVTVNIEKTNDTEQLVAYYPFNGNANDESGNGYHGTENGNPTLATDRFSNANSAFEFDGVDDYIDVGQKTIFNNPSAITISVWIRPNNTEHGKIIAKGFNVGSNRAGFTWEVANMPGTIRFGVSDGSNYTDVLSNNTVNVGSWHHIVGTYNGSVTSIYLDGVLENSNTAISGKLNNETGPLQIGRENSGGSGNAEFNGSIDDIRIYNYAISEMEISDLYHEGGWPVNDPYADMIYIPAGEFTMGSTSGGADEQPVHTVYLDAYYIDKYEVTKEEYAIFLNESMQTGDIQVGSDRVTKDGNVLILINNTTSEISYNSNQFVVDNGKEKYPVVHLTWYGADAYAKHHGKRLPTEAEWENAARGTDQRNYPWGNEIPTSEHCNFNGPLLPVGQYIPKGDSPYGCTDMAGNVWEWCNDLYDADYYSISPANNPQGSTNGVYRVIRGGSWRDGTNKTNLRTANRHTVGQTSPHDNVGFRCVR